MEAERKFNDWRDNIPSESKTYRSLAEVYKAFNTPVQVKSSNELDLQVQSENPIYQEILTDNADPIGLALSDIGLALTKIENSIDPIENYSYADDEDRLKAGVDKRQDVINALDEKMLEMEELIESMRGEKSKLQDWIDSPFTGEPEGVEQDEREW